MKVSLDGGNTWNEADEVLVRYDACIENTGAVMLQLEIIPEGIWQGMLDGNGAVLGGSNLSIADMIDKLTGLECSECGAAVDRVDTYAATPCGTFCVECMENTHARSCGICAKEFDITFEE